MKRPSILVVGMGRLGSALASQLVHAGYRVSTVRSRTSPIPRKLADVVWLCVPDSAISSVTENLSSLDWEGKYAFHASGVLASDVLEPLQASGASIASVHPLMTFVRGSKPELAGVPFAIEGDTKAVRIARAIVGDLDAEAFAIRKGNKIAYHAFATMICPLLVSLLATAEQTAKLAGMSEGQARRRMMPILRQTLRNYERLGPAEAFSGPIVRGDVATVRSHVKKLRQLADAQSVYTSLARAALKYLPGANSRELTRQLKAQASAT